MIYTPIEDLELLLNLDEEAELYGRISGQFKTLNEAFWDRANLRLFEHLHLDRPARVLDWACGGGGFAIEMARKYPKLKVVGVDVHPGMLDQARRDAEAAGVKNIEFLQHDLQHLLPDFKDKHFDLGVCLFALSYLGVEKVLKEMRRLLGAKGQLGITTSSFNSLKEWQPFFFQFFAEYQDKIDFSDLPKAPHQPVDAGDMARRMEGAGFTDVHTEIINVPLAFENIRQAACFFISSTWLSNQLYSVKDKKFRRFVVEWAMDRIGSLYAPGTKISTSVEFIVAWNSGGR
jgi:ubiquinone/menaquinone biosynthesis C-methylase UbiE